jgi:phosphoesterase RecJ-like protein
LPNSAQIKLEPPSRETEILLVVDAGSLDRIGEKLAKKIAPPKTIINIDHHATAVKFGDYNFIDPNAAASCEIIYKLIQLSGMKIGMQRAICLYVGIMFDTYNFRYSNTTPATHQVAADLIREGVQPQELFERVYESVAHSKLKLMGLVLSTVQVSRDGKIAWMRAEREMFKKSNTSKEDCEGLINYLSSIKDISLAIFFGEDEFEDGKTRVSLRSKNGIEADKFASFFGGGGHKRAAGCTLNAPLKEAIDTVITEAQRFIEQSTVSVATF